MSLFGDLPQAKNEASGEGDKAQTWATPALQPVMRKQNFALAPPPSVLRAGRGQPGGGRGGLAGAGRGPGAGRGSGGGLGSRTSSGDGSTVPTPGQPHEPSASSVTATSIFGEVKEEYDPARPNDYEEVVKERKAKRRAAELEAERQAKIKEMEAIAARLVRPDLPGAPPGTAAQAPDPGARDAMLNISGEEAFARRARLSGRPAPSSTPDEDDSDGIAGLGSVGGLGLGGGGGGLGLGSGGGHPASAAPPKASGMGLAQKLLEKMGWKEGDGLGRTRQGMATPLMAKKTDKRAGLIVNAEPTSQVDKKQRTGGALQGKPSKVICMRNMVLPGQVDEELEDEVGEELMKYGNVQSVMIFEVTTVGYPPEEAVRIFVEFDRVEAATKAMIDLQGRFFGGNSVRVAFFNEARFGKDDLAPQPGEFDA